MQPVLYRMKRQNIQLTGLVSWGAYKWETKDFKAPATGLLFTKPIGMAPLREAWQYREFTGCPACDYKKRYNTIQLMAIQEHPFTVLWISRANFLLHLQDWNAWRSKMLIDNAHAAGIRVIMTLSFTFSKNVNEGWGCLTDTGQYFHTGKEETISRGFLCFDYGKTMCSFPFVELQVLLEEYKFDGFRFDGNKYIYYNHGWKRIYIYDDYSMAGRMRCPYLPLSCISWYTVISREH